VALKFVAAAASFGAFWCGCRPCAQHAKPLHWTRRAEEEHTVRRISVATNRPDCLIVRVGRDVSKLLAWSGVMAGFVALLAFVERDAPFGMMLTLTDMVLMPMVGVALSRFARTTERSLVRSNGRLLLDGEPLELARVELRVLKMPLTRVPTGYALSLWVMTASGPEDVPIGNSRTLLEASALSGQLEDFVARANVKQHRHA